ncbi:MAG TPA: hypothetical protein VHM31_06610 [Polyangia bacterium]|nr:hypothetical protein [Polyangia bacterium]
MRSAGPLAAMLTALLAGAGCDPHVNLGTIGDGSASLIWKATFEPGDFSEWSRDGQGGTYREDDNVPADVVSTPVHRGSKAGVFAVTPAASMVSISYAFRNQPATPSAYYSAWFYVPSTIVVGSYLSLVHFRGSLTGDGRNPYAIWDVNLTPLADGTVAAQLFDYVKGIDTPQPLMVRFPPDRWVQLEVLFVKATGPTGRVAIWQDGTLILDHPNVTTVANDWLQWEVGGASDDLTGTALPALVYVDDAAISLVRLGPDDPF